MENDMKTTEVINDLIRINNDRIEGYQKAVEELPADSLDLKAMFQDFISQSDSLKMELQQRVSPAAERVEDETTMSGKIYRGWMGIKQAFTSNDRKSVLESCEFGEDAAQKAYQAAEQEDNLAPEVRALISSQKQQLRSAHDRVKQLRDVERQ